MPRKRKNTLWSAVLTGMALSFIPTQSTPIPTPTDDAKALRGDWERVGSDIRTAIKREAARLGTHPGR